MLLQEISAEVPLKRPECALQASESDGLHTCQSQQDVIQHLITVLTDLQDRVTGGVTPAAASARALQTSTRVDEVSAEMEIKEGGTGALGSLKTQAHVEEEEGGAKPSSDLRAGDESSLEVKVESAKQSVALERVDTRRRALQDFSAGKGRRPIARGSMKTNVNGRTRHWAP